MECGRRIAACVPLPARGPKQPPLEGESASQDCKTERTMPRGWCWPDRLVNVVDYLNSTMRLTVVSSPPTVIVANCCLISSKVMQPGLLWYASTESKRVSIRRVTVE